jgi:hypothetical protein
MSKVSDKLQEIYMKENYDIDAEGMMGRVPPLHTEEVGVTDEEADKQMNKKLPWSKAGPDK